MAHMHTSRSFLLRAIANLVDGLPLLLLTVFFYIMWTGRQMDQGRYTVEEVHLSLTFAVLAGLALRVYLRKIDSSHLRTAVRVLWYFIGALVLTGFITEALLLAIASDAWQRLKDSADADNYRYLQGVVVPIGIVLVFASVALTPSAIAAACGILLFVPFFGSLLGNGDGGIVQARSEKTSLRAIVASLAIAIGTAWWLYIGLLEVAPVCAESQVCSEYSVRLLQFRCQATCVVARGLSSGLDGLAAILFVVFVLRLFEAVGGYVRRHVQPTTGLG